MGKGDKTPLLQKSGPLEKTAYPLQGIPAEWLKLPLFSITAEAILAFPARASKMHRVPLIIVQHGKKDAITYWPAVVQEFDRVKEHYRKLSIDNRMEMVMHEGGHEAIVDKGVVNLTVPFTNSRI